MNRIIIADDHPIFRSGIRAILEEMNHLEIVGEAGNGVEAYQLIISKLPDIAILDLEMPLLNGLEVCSKVLNEKHVTKFIILTMHKEKHYIKTAMQSGVSGYLLKDHAIQNLKECIKAVSQNQHYLSADLKYLYNESSTDDDSEILEIIKQLTPTEKIILKLIGESKTSSEIASLLFVSPNTIDNHRSNIAKKLKLNGEKNSLLKFAIKFYTNF